MLISTLRRYQNRKKPLGHIDTLNCDTTAKVCESQFIAQYTKLTEDG